MAFLPDDREERADLYFPLEMPIDARLPAVVWIHGGGWNGGQRDGSREINVGSTLARNGYVAMSIDYKLSKGAQTVWPQNLHDCKTAIRWLRKNADRLGIDPERIGVMGGSAGGHLAAMVALTTPSDGLDPAEPYGEFSCSVNCCVDMYGIANLAKYHDAKMLGKTIAEAPELYRQASPVTYVRKDSVPFLILHGTADTTVSIDQSKEFAEVLQKAGVEHEFIAIPDAPHTFDLQPKQRDLRPVVLGFLNKHLKPATAAASPSPAPAKSPNIVLVISDQHFADAMGCAGDAHVKTPALDSLAATGVRSRNTYCTYPVCMSSRASLMTGLWPHQLGKTDTEGAPEDGKKGSGKRGKSASQLEATISLATRLRSAGYETAYFGKWHVGGSSSKPGSPWRGFDIIDDGRIAETTAKQAAEFIQRKHDKPFFLVVSFLNPHDICEWARLRSGIRNKMLNGEIAIEPPVADCPQTLPSRRTNPRSSPCAENPSPPARILPASGAQLSGGIIAGPMPGWSKRWDCMPQRTTGLPRALNTRPNTTSATTYPTSLTAVLTASISTPRSPRKIADASPRSTNGSSITTTGGGAWRCRSAARRSPRSGMCDAEAGRMFRGAR